MPRDRETLDRLSEGGHWRGLDLDRQAQRQSEDAEGEVVPRASVAISFFCVCEGPEGRSRYQGARGDAPIRLEAIQVGVDEV